MENLEEELEAVMQSDAELSPEDIAKVEGILEQSVQIDDGDDEENDAVDGDVALDPDDKSLIAQAELGKELKCQGIVSGDLSPDVLDIANALSQSDDYKDMPLEELLVEAAKHHSAKVKDAVFKEDGNTIEDTEISNGQSKPLALFITIGSQASYNAINRVAIKHRKK